MTSFFTKSFVAGAFAFALLAGGMTASAARADEVRWYHNDGSFQHSWGFDGQFSPAGYFSRGFDHFQGFHRQRIGGQQFGPDGSREFERGRSRGWYDQRGWERSFLIPAGGGW